MTLNFKTVVFTLIICSIIISCKTKKHQRVDDIAILISKELDTLISKPEINGASLGVYYKGKTYEFHKGKLDKGMNTYPTKNTIYEIASLTKTFSGILLAQAITEGRVSLDDDIRNYLKGNFPNLEYQGHPITFRNLVTHRSGLPIIFPNKPEIFTSSNKEKLPFLITDLQKDFTKKDFFNELHMVKIDTVPGTKFGYSNPGANLLGYCLENIYKMSFEELLTKKILTPLKMNNTKITLTEEEKKLLAQGYNGKNQKMPFEPEMPMKAAGGILSTTGDMIKYMRFHLNQNDEVIKISHKKLLGLWEDFDNGLFWQIFINKNKPDIIFQNGGAFGTSSWLTLIPNKQIGVFIITNKKDDKTHNHLKNTLDKIIDKLK
ncbi:serine hydrolase domain-containing protein [Tenacibaculum sp.]|uniref:serine hydrolase domain-containing protein n=1 Tax=Tenacibaculum sp. TaxID=1906242 RepID=UPI003D0FCCEE